MRCPKCNADISETYEPAYFSVGIMAGGYFCDACDLSVGEEDYEPQEDDVMIGSGRDPGDKLGTPLSELSGQPGDPKNPNDPRHAGYDRFKRIARSWGYD